MALARAPVAKPAFGASAKAAAAPSKASVKVAAAPRPVEAAKALAENVGKMATVLASTALVAGAANAITYDELQSLSYLEVKGTGLANVCPVVATDGATDSSGLKSGSYKLEKFCLEPTEFTVKEESQFKGGNTEFVKTKLMTRLTYTLDGMEGVFTADGSGNVSLTETEGLDFAPVTVQLPGGERVPFLFTAKNLDAKGKADAFEGNFVVPAYRGSSFLDPKGRGGSTGYDNAVALPARSDAAEFAKENNKVVAPLVGKMRLSLAAYNKETGEIGGVFESIQPSDTDLGSKEPKDIKITGLWYAQIQ